ncbi:ribosomal protein S1 [Streptomyces sp. HB202]|nr:ribosomal protein S1 [Streptomyces sp. HB202]
MTSQPSSREHLLAALAGMLYTDDADVNPGDLADVLWMSRIIGALPPADYSSLDTPLSVPAPNAPDGQEDALSPLPGAGGDGFGATASEPCARNTTTVRLHTFDETWSAASGQNSAHVVQVSRPAFLSDPLHLNRALRPLRQRVAAFGPPVLDEEATAQATSEAACLIPVWRPATKPRFSVDLVVDTGSTMAVWHHLAGELGTLLERHGAFHSVRQWAMNTDTETPTLARFRRRTPIGLSGPQPSAHWHRPLKDTTGTRLLLVLTDAVGPAWYGPSLPVFLARQTSARPAAVLHVLPRRLWHRTAVQTQSVDARITDPARPVMQFRTRHRPTTPPASAGTSDTQAPCTRWLPVMEVHGSWLAPWAEHLGGRSTDWVPMLATPLGDTPCPPREKENDAEGISPEERVARFHVGSTPMAYRLACYLAAVPLSLPVMRIVQRALVPRSQQTDLAQLFVSGLIARREQQHFGQSPDDVVYDFRPGVREELLAELTRRESLLILEDVLAKVSGRVAATFGGTLDFRALASLVSNDVRPASTPLDPRSLPFAEVAVAVLSGAGGQHRSIARLLEQAVLAQAQKPPADSEPAVPRTSRHKPGDIVHGTVASAEADRFIITLGDEEAVLSHAETQPHAQPTVGDTIDVLILKRRDPGGRYFVSHRQAVEHRHWQRLRELHRHGHVVDGTVVDVVKGGLILDVGIRAFLPASLVETRRVRNFRSYLGRTLQAKIIDLDVDRKNIILSRRALLEESESEARTHLLNTLRIGEVRRGTVSSIVPFGAFVDLGGLDGLVHISELSWTRIEHPSDVVELGQEIEVQVTAVDLGRQRVTLSLKETEEDPWSAFARRHSVGEILPATVNKIVPFGAFVRVADGIEGLVHISELADHHVDDPGQIVRIGEEIFVSLLDADVERRRFAFSIKQANASLGGDPTRVEFDPPRYGMTASYDNEGNYIFPEGFDPETNEWLPGSEEQQEEWLAQYSEAQRRFEQHRAQVFRAQQLGTVVMAFNRRWPSAVALARSLHRRLNPEDD